MRIEATLKTPQCGVCGKKYDQKEIDKDIFNNDNQFYGTNLYTNETNFWGKPKVWKRIELCGKCFTGIEKMRRYQDWEVVFPEEVKKRASKTAKVKK